MRCTIVRTGGLLCAFSLIGCEPQQAASKTLDEPSEFVRFVPIGDDEGRFETAIHTYERADGSRVSLIAAVHIADAAHYGELQREFTGYDVLLYELVAEAGVRPVPGEARGGGMLSMLQTGLKRGLDLEFQLDAVDYSPANFVHADLTPQAMKDMMEERGETYMSMFLNLAFREMQKMQTVSADGEARQGGMVDLVSAFQRREGRHLLRMELAKLLAAFEISPSAGEGTETVLLEGRNERVIEVLRKQLGRGHDRIGIYYGAAHMTGIELSLVEELGFEKVEERWLTAWDLTKRKDPARRGR